ncbi:uncharacterized protein LOC129752092 [Uranotaenia lowii]|uniref:uncharacterized protein LOC129752092 n=1 Tax=Uranotaenia lowii TaxID=190385 RepID=UPI00247A13AC|nr:uncharacterized protein LOC129752092 [Uranotaenia lowii]
MVKVFHYPMHLPSGKSLSIKPLYSTACKFTTIAIVDPSTRNDMNTRRLMMMAVIGAVLLIAPAVFGQDEQEDINVMPKERQLAIIDEMIRGQHKIQQALRRMLKKVDGVEIVGSDEDVNNDSAGGSEEQNQSGSQENSAEEHEWERERQRRIREAREQMEQSVNNIAARLMESNGLIEGCEQKVDHLIEEQHEHSGEVEYNLHYNKPHHHHHHHNRHSSESESEEYKVKLQKKKKKNAKRPSRPHYRGARMVEEDDVEDNDETVSNVDGEEIVQTLPVE